MSEIWVPIVCFIGALFLLKTAYDWQCAAIELRDELNRALDRISDLESELRGYHVQQGWAPPAEGGSDEK